MNRFLLSIALFSTIASAEPVTYRVDPARSEVVALTKPAGLGAGLSHPHVIEAKGLEGKIVHDAAAPERSSIEISAPTAKLVNDDPAAVTRHGHKPSLSAEDRKKIADEIQSPAQLDGAKFPTLSFKSTSVRALPGGKLELTGQLGIHGVTKEVKLPVTVTVGADGALQGEGSLSITHTQFGFKPVSLLFGAIANDDAVELKVKLLATPAS